jgi:hypothetical protein
MSSKPENPGLAAARRALKAQSGPPDGYRPSPSVFPGRRVKVLSGQFDLYGQEHQPRPAPVDVDEVAEEACEDL